MIMEKFTRSSLLLGRSLPSLKFACCLLILLPINKVCSSELSKVDNGTFRTRWRTTSKTIYNGDSVEELLGLCSGGCTDCPEFAVLETNGSKRTQQPCENEDIITLRRAQDLVKGWRDAVETSEIQLIVHSVMVCIIVVLIVVLIVRGHYRVKDLWFLPTERQWQMETDPTWGLPGKVWSLLRIRVVKSANKEPTKRKYLSYTENPTVMGDKFWFFKQALRDMYKAHKYYKRNRYFHKLAWQITKQGKVTPETLRRHKALKRRAGEVEKVRLAPSPPPELDPLVRLPLAVDLPDELNNSYLRKAKEILNREVEKLQKRFINGRYQPHATLQQHHHHHRHRQSAILLQQPPLTFDEMSKYAKEMETDPNADFVMVNDIMKVNPNAKKQALNHLHHHHHHEHEHHHHEHEHHHHRHSEKSEAAN